MLNRNKAIWLYDPSHKSIFNQSEGNILASHNAMHHDWMFLPSHMTIFNQSEVIISQRIIMQTLSSTIGCSESHDHFQPIRGPSQITVIIQSA